MKIGILGGTFDPPHQGHLHISLLALKRLQLKELWWIPTLKNPLKKFESLMSYDERVERCQLLTSNYSAIKVKKLNYYYAIELINILKKNYPQHEFVWVMGADNLVSFHRWFGFNKIIHQVEFAIFARDNFLLKIRNYAAYKIYNNFRLKYAKKFKKLPKFSIFFTAKNATSSTKIRQS